MAASTTTIKTQAGTFRIREHHDSGLMLGRRVHEPRIVHVAEEQTPGGWRPIPQHGDTAESARAAIDDITRAVVRNEMRGEDLG